MSLGPGTSELTPTLVDPPRMPARTEVVRRQFDQRAARLPQHEALLREVDRRLMERLDLVKLAPRSIVDVGCGGGASEPALRARYPQALWTGVDLSLAQLRRIVLPAARFWRAPRLRRVAAEAGALPLAAGSVDLVYSNLMLHWHPAPHSVFPEWLRVLRVDGLLLFSCLGPDTLRELRAACAAALPLARPLPFVDMHDFGDMMVASGFAAPVMDTERITLTYPSAAALLREVGALGGNPRDDRAAHLPSGRQARALLAALAARAGADGRIALTFEVAYGHAWKPAPRAPGGAVALETLRQTLPSRGGGPARR